MIPWLRYVNLALFAILLLLAAATLTVFALPSKEFQLSLPPLLESLPPNPFAQPKEAYELAEKKAFALKWTPPHPQLPDLKKEILFIGCAMRPDMKNSCFIYLNQEGKTHCVEQDAPIYLHYIRAAQLGESGTYQLSLRASPLSIKIHALGEKSARCSVRLIDEQGVEIQTPVEYHSFDMQLHEAARSTVGWEIDGVKADSSLLMRQRAKWVGRDLFLEWHGGEEYAHTMGRERIDFGEGEEFYSCFVKVQDSLIWKEGAWRAAEPGEETRGYPLLLVKKMDEKVLTFELWDPEGMQKLHASLMRHAGLGAQLEPLAELKFVGTKTWTQFILETKTANRMTVKLQDWLLFTPEGWELLDTIGEIEDYVAQRITGHLLVVDALSKQNGKQVLNVHLFNPSRTAVQEIALPAHALPLGSPLPVDSLALPLGLKGRAE
jgi:hypothetical protein